MAYHEDWEDSLTKLIVTVLSVVVTIALVLLTGLWRYVVAAFGRHGFHPIMLACAGATIVALALAVFFALSSGGAATAWAIGMGSVSALTFAVTDGVLTFHRIQRGESLLHEDLSQSSFLDHPWWE